MFSLEELWLKLSTSHIGFYTHRHHEAIPQLPGVYAWFLPLRLKGEPQDFLVNTRQILAYDSGSRSTGKWESNEAGFKWDPLHVRIERNTDRQISEVQDQKWALIGEAPPAVKARFRVALMAASIFSKPLYVGLSNDLLRRYLQHISDGSGFSERFHAHVNALHLDVKVSQLLFACIPFRPTESGDTQYTDDQISVLEHMLKIICQPAFGDL
jgi:hypothetical protein